MDKFKDSGHLFRLAAVFAAGFLVLVLARGFLLPKSFGQYGHFRGDAMHEIAALPVNYAGHDTCESCHSDVFDIKKTGKHASVRCESCHGPQAKHADDPGTLKPERPNVATLCIRCHEANSAKPRKFPQVVSEEHSGGVVCNTCHTPHSPAIGGAEDKKPEDKKLEARKSGAKNPGDKKK
jgi:hypothetical protein